jgi:hypothetical protein
VTIAIRSVLHRLPLADLNEDLRQMLHRVNTPTAIQKIVHNLVRCPRVQSLSRRDIHSWELIAEFANILEQLVGIILHPKTYHDGLVTAM